MEEILRRAYILGLVSLLFIFSAIINPEITGFTTWSPTGQTSELVIWDQTDVEGGNMDKRTYPTAYNDISTQCWEKTPDTLYKIYFFANYTNSSSDGPINDSYGLCEIRFDRNDDTDYGDAGEGWVNMSYNISSMLWENFTNFTYDGILNFEINCSSALFYDFVLSDNVSINNTAPCIFGRQAGPTDPLPPITCSEDVTCYYDFSDNCTDDDQNDISSLIYSRTVDAQYSSYITMDSAGMLQVAMTDNENSTEVRVTMLVDDSVSPESVSMNVTIYPVNDLPQFDSLPSSVDEDTEFAEYVITATDEDDNIPFKFNATFLSCQKESWISYPNDNCSIFNFTVSDDNLTIENFTPTNWDVGTYQINFTVEDSGSQYPQFNYNSTNYQIVWFNVTNVNDQPSIVSWNGTEIELTQGDHLYMTFNGTDIENDTLFFNTTTLVWNSGTSNYDVYQNASLFPITINDTYYPNESAYGIMNYTLSVEHAGNYTINVTVMDNGANPVNMTSYTLFNITVHNLNDPPTLVNVPATLPDAIQEIPYYYDFNATDPDLHIMYGDNLTFGFDFVFCETPLGIECSIDPGSSFNLNKTDNDTAEFYVYATANDTGNYTFNVTVTDDAGLLNWTLVNLTIHTDEAPIINAPESMVMTQNQTFFYYFNVTDPENDTVTITNVTLYRNMTQLAVNLFPVDVDTSTYPPIYNLSMNYTNVTNEQVGNYTLLINATDVWNRSRSHSINITAYNINDPPRIINFTDCSGNTTYPLNFSAYENENSCFKPNDPDPDLLVPAESYTENLTYSVTLVQCVSDIDYYPSGNCSGSSVIGMDHSTGEIQFTADNETWHGNYTYNFSIQDDAGENVSKLFTMEILTINDPPVIVNISDSINMSARETFTYKVNATDEENNTPFTFNVSFTCDGSPCTLFTVNYTTGDINFTPNISHIGNYTANFTVTDAGNSTFNYDNSTGWNVSNISVLWKYGPPTIRYFTPYGSPAYNMTEGTTKEFRYEANDTVDNDTLTCYWYINNGTVDRLITTVENPQYNCNTSGSTGYWYYNVSYDDALNLSQMDVNITLSVVDPQGFVVNETLEMTVVSGNRPPRYLYNILSPIQWYTGMSITPIDLDNHFEDDYGEILTYSYTGASNVDVAINADNSVTFSAPSWFGTDLIQFIANDSEYDNESDVITLEVFYQEPEEVEKEVTVTRLRVASMEIIVDYIIEVPALNISRAKVIIKNDGDYNLNGIYLSTFTNVSDLELNFKDDYIHQLSIDQNASRWLELKVGDLEPGTYSASIFANSTSPELEESASINIKVTPTNSTRIKIQIVMVKDMFEENPECMDLFGLIVQAEKHLNENSIAEARRLTQLAMDNCQDMIDYAKVHESQKSTETTPSVVGQIFINPFFVMGFVIALLALAMAGYWLMSKQESRKKDNPKKMYTGS